MSGLLVGLWLLLCLPAESSRRGDDQVTSTSSSTLYQVAITDGDKNSGADAQARLIGPKGEVYFTLLNPVRPMDVVLFNDGTLLTVDDTAGMGRGVTLALYEANGNCRWSRAIAELIEPDILSDIPQNGSLYWWRTSPLEWRWEGSTLLIAMGEERWMRIQMADGDAEIVTTTFSGSFPELLVVRAHAAATREARDLYSRALARDPSQIGGWLGLAELLQQSGQHVAAIDVLDQALSTNQIPPADSPERELYVQIFLEQARSQTNLGGLASSEGVLGRALEIAPDNQTANLAMAGLLLDGNRAPEADALLEEWIARGSKLQRSIVVGDFYAESGAWQSAANTYTEVWRLTQDVMMGSRLVEAHRMLGEFDQAIAIRRQQIRRWDRLGAHEEFVAMAREDIEQLEIAKGFQ